MLTVIGGSRDRQAARGRTAAASIHALLRDDILSLRLEPGSQLNEKDIAAQHGVSRTPVREALLRLSDEGLVDIISEVGNLCVAASRSPTFTEAITIRRVLGAACCPRRGRAGDPEPDHRHSGPDRGAHRRGRGGWQYAKRFHRADEAFHEAIAAIGRPSRGLGARQACEVAGRPLPPTDAAARPAAWPASWRNTTPC